MKPTAKATSSDRQDAAQAQRRPMAEPLHPYIVMLVAIVLPGVGQVLNDTPARDSTMIFSMMLLGIVTFHLTTPNQSFAGRYEGGFVIYSISVMAPVSGRGTAGYYHRYGGKERGTL